MKTRASMERRDMVAACALALIVAAFLCAWTPSLRPVFSALRPAPPSITYCPALLATSDHQEYYDEWNAVHSPALIALSAAMMQSADKSGQTDTVAPPLETASRLIRFPDTYCPERNDQITMLTPPRPMTTLVPQRLALAAPGSASGPQRPSAATQAYRMDLTGNWQGRSVDLTPMLALNEPSGPWSFTAVLRYDETGRVQHALLESAELDLPLRDEITRRLYQCRVTPGNTPGEGRLTVSGPGRTSRQ